MMNTAAGVTAHIYEIFVQNHAMAAVGGGSGHGGAVQSQGMGGPILSL
jgi:hypothetical protein